MIQKYSIEKGKKVYFASDFHLGVPSKEKSLLREKKIIRWLDTIKEDASIIFLVGDIFDFWFEYKHTIPKGFIRFQGKLAELKDNGIEIYFFTGNHDMWMFSYFEEELGISIIREPISMSINSHTFLIGHGDGLGPGDSTYKILKKIFSNKVCQWLFNWLHPNIGMGIANAWSRKSRIANTKSEEKSFGEKEWLIQYCKKAEKDKHHDFYIFGHRHLPIEYKINNNSTYINLGEWVNFNTYAVFDGDKTELKTFEK